MNVGDKKCAECEHTFKPHRWGSTKAWSDGWFLQKDGTAYCPDHVPAWVEEWRKRREAKK